MSATPLPWEEAAQQKAPPAQNLMPWDEAKTAQGGPDPNNPAASVHDPKSDILTPSGYQQKTAASPFAPAGQAEEAMGEGMSNKEQLQQGGKNLLGAGIATAGGMIGAPAAAAVLPAVVPAAMNQAAKHPLITKAIVSAGIGEARRIPYVGRLIPSGAELLPYLIPGGKGAGDAEDESTPEAEPEQKATAPPVVIAPPRSEYPPAAPSVIQRPLSPVPGSPEDIAETRSIQEEVRDRAEGEDRSRLSAARRDWFARNQPGSTKGELTGTADKPVRYTKTPGVKIAAPPSGTVVPAPDEDLTPLLEKSLKAAKKAKG